MAGCTYCGGPLDTMSSTEITCTVCGRVNDGTQMVNELSFGESASGAATVHGSFLNADQGSSSRGLYGHSGNSRAMTIDKARNQMMGVAHNLKIPESTVMQAVAHFKQALHTGFVKGRKSRFVTSACLYLACRQHKTAHMLMNFASLLYVNVFVLGSTYLQLVRNLGIRNIPPIDPTLFIQRFVSKLDFPSENDGRKVMRDAIRLVQRMSKDWIAEGRRPAGVAAASVLLACRMNNFRKSKLQIMQLAMISESTINDRIKEFKITDAATLTIRDFRATNVDSSADPPAFTRNRELERLEEIQRPLREKLNPLDNPEIRGIYEFVMDSVEKDGLQDPEEEFINNLENLESAAPRIDKAETEEADEPEKAEAEKEGEEPEKIAEETAEKEEPEKDTGETAKKGTEEPEKDAEETAEKATEPTQEKPNLDKDLENSPPPADSTNTTTAMPPPSATRRVARLRNPIEDRQARIQSILQRHNHPIVRVSTAKRVWDPTAAGISDDPDNLSDVDDDEIDGVVLPSHIAEQKEVLWLSLNKDYVLDEARKRNKMEADIQAGTYKEPRKRKKPASTGAGHGRQYGGAAGAGGAGPAQTAAEAATNMAKKKKFSRKINYNAFNNLFD